MNLTLNQFNVLVEIERRQEIGVCINQLANVLHETKENVLKILTELTNLELIEEADLNYLVTLNTPKPMIKVGGTRIIETLLDAVVKAGIEDITIVRGYLGEQFELLLKKYPNIKFIDNDKFNEANNISSALMIKDMLDHAYVLESDLVLYNQDIIRKYEYQTNYLGKKVDETDDWCFKVNDGHIESVHVGGKFDNCYHMYGISYWDSQAAKKMSNDIESVFNMEPDGPQKYWDEVALRFFKDHYDVLVKPVYEGDIIEIDTYDELKTIDPIYDV